MLRKLTAPLTGPCVSSASEEEVDEVFAHAQLMDLSINVKPESSGELQSKSAVEIFMEEKQEKVTAKKKMTAKLAMLEKEVTLGQHLLQQTKSLLKSKEALLMRKVRVTYNKCHSFMRGKVVYAHRSFVAEQVAAAKARLGLANTSHQFNIPAMVALIDKLAPEGKYLSSKPAPVPTATSRPWRRRLFTKMEAPSVRYFTAPVPSMPIQQRGERAAPAQETSCHHQQSSAWYGGDYSIVSDGDVCYQEPFYDNVAQLSQDDHCLQSTAETIDQGYFDDITEQQEFNNSDVCAEEEVLSDVSVEASLCWDSDGDIYY